MGKKWEFMRLSGKQEISKIVNKYWETMYDLQEVFIIYDKQRQCW